MLPEGTPLKRGKYITGKIIRSSQMSNVYHLEENPYIGRKLILKELCPKMQPDGKALLRISPDSFEYQKYQEAFAYERLATINISSLFPEMNKYYVDSFEENQIQYLVLQYIPGRTLTKYRTENSHTPKMEELILSLLRTVGRLHKNNFIHGDISPDNIIIPDNIKEVVLIDYGNAIINQNVPFSMKNGFSGPELYAEAAFTVGRASDIYAIGATIYYLITGRTVADTDSLELTANVKSPFYRWVISRCLKEAPQKRFSSCEMLRAAFYAYRLLKIFMIMAALVVTLSCIQSNPDFHRQGIKAPETYNREPEENTHALFTYEIINGEIHIIGSASSVTEVLIPEEINGIPVASIDGINKNVTGISISEGVTAIGDYAFMNCQYLTWIQIPDSIIYIGEDAFQNCGQLETIEISPGNKAYRTDNGKLINRTDNSVLFEGNKTQH